MNRTLAQEWQYARPYSSEGERGGPPLLERYNWAKPRSSCGDLLPMSRIVGVNNVIAHNS